TGVPPVNTTSVAGPRRRVRHRFEVMNLRRPDMKNAKYLTCALLIAASAANAQMSPNMAMPKPASAAAQPSALTEGVVQAVDASKGVVTLKHGEIVNMQMPAMTMA